MIENSQDFVIEDSVLIKYTGPGGDVVIPEGVTKIGSNAFWGCTSLQSAAIPTSVTEIGDRAFKYCEGLQSVTIPAGVTKIGDWAFADCTSLQSVTISEGVAEIGDGAFWSCIRLQSVVIPRSVKDMRRSMFAIHHPVLIVPHIPVANLQIEDKPGACVGFARLYLENAELDEKIKAGYFNYIKKKRKRLYSYAIRYEELLQVMLAGKLVFRKDIDPLLEECDKQNNIAAKAAILDYAGKHLKPVDPLKEFKLKDL